MTLAYEVTVDHNRRCLHCSPGFYGSMNDKTIIKFDRLVSSINNYEMYSENEYELFDINGNIAKEKGLYLLSDNGYHPWRCLQYPNRTKSNTDILLHHDWSCRLESIRKDVECFFGILKRRWKLLQYGIRTDTIKSADNLLFTCCALHNIILDWDAVHETREDIHDDEIENVGEEVMIEMDDVVPVARDNPKQDHIDLEMKLVSHFTFLKKQGILEWLR